jgi:hypothetical protein
VLGVILCCGFQRVYITGQNWLKISLNTYYTQKHLKLISIQYYNMNINLLDLNNDILNIIGDYVKKDNLTKELEIEEQILNGKNRIW